jgi:diadenylate cyclase
MRTDPRQDKNFLTALSQVAPGTALRSGIDDIIRAELGALLVIGDPNHLAFLFSGGMRLDLPFKSQLLYELAKMDGAIVLNQQAGKIVYANVQLMPDPAIPSDETGTRHRTAERVARQTGLPVISVSASMRIIALYVGDQRYVLEGSTTILSRANQALATLERYKSRLDEVSGTLSALEIEDLVTVRDVSAVVQRLEMVRRISEEIEGYVVELGTDGRLLTLQLDELVGGIGSDRELVIRDYVDTSRRDIDSVQAALAELDSTELLDIAHIARVLGLPGGGDALDAAAGPRGYRLLSKVPRLPGAIVDRLVSHFGGLQKLLAAGIDDLMAVDGVGEQRARAVREGLSRLAESSILERYV